MAGAPPRPPSATAWIQRRVQLVPQVRQPHVGMRLQRREHAWQIFLARFSKKAVRHTMGVLPVMSQGTRTSTCACASAMEPKERLTGRAVGGVANCDRLNTLDPGVRMLRGDSSFGDACPCKQKPSAPSLRTPAFPA